MGVGAGLYMYDVVVKEFTFAISSPDEFLSNTNCRDRAKVNNSIFLAYENKKNSLLRYFKCVVLP